MRVVEAGEVCTTLLILQLHNQLKNRGNCFECAITTTPALPSNKPRPMVPHPSLFRPALDKDLDDISCGGQSPWDAIIGGSSDHYARTQDQWYSAVQVISVHSLLLGSDTEWMGLWGG